MKQAPVKAEAIAGYALLMCYVLAGAVSQFVWNPHFEEIFSVWKMIMGMSHSYTGDYHHFNDLFLLQYVYERLYAFNNTIPWFPFSLWLLSYAASGVMLWVLWRYGRQQRLLLHLRVLLWLVALALLSASWLWIHHNRTSFLLTAAGMLLLVHKLTSYSGNRLRWVLVCTGIIALGLLLRFEAATVMLFLLLPTTYFLLAAKVINPAHLLPPYMLILLVGVSYVYLSAVDNDFRWQLEPDVEYELMDRRNWKPLPATATPMDSMRRETIARWWMMGDVALNDAPYIRSLIHKPDTWVHRYLFFLFPSSKQAAALSFTERLQRFLQANSLYFLLLCGLLLTAAGAWWKGARLHLLLFVTFALLLLISSFTVNEYRRVTEPLLSIAWVWSVYLWMRTAPVSVTRLQKSVQIVWVALLLFFAGKLVYAHHCTAAEQNLQEAQIENRLNTILANNPQRSYVLTAANYTAYKTPALHAFTGFGNKTLLLPEIGQYSANPAFLATWASISGCAGDDFKCRMQFIDKHKHEIIFISNEKRMKVYEQYMQAVYGVRLNWSSAPRVYLAEDTYCWMP